MRRINIETGEIYHRGDTPTKEDLIKGMKERKVAKYDELKKKYPTKLEEAKS